MSSEVPVIYNEFTTASGHRLMVATLNSEPTLNSLTIEMIQSFRKRLDEVAKDPLTVAIWLQGTGAKAFCAGGDIKKLYTSIKERTAGTPNDYADKFFEAEYSLDYRIHSFPKPIICWGHGLVMGGGLGLFAGSKFRIVTDTSRLAMPEISIGLYPDVGATWFLSKMPYGIGLYLGLTGTRLNGSDAVYAGLATHYIKTDQKGQILSAIQNEQFTMSPGENREKLAAIFQAHAQKSQADAPVSELQKHKDFIASFANHPNIESLAAAWKSHIDNPDPWIKTGIHTFFRGSPTSAKIIFEQIKRASELKNLKETFQRELGMTIHFARGHDLLEGVRALLIDKDNKPNWNPKKLSEISAAEVNKYFSSPWPNENANPLKALPDGA